MKLTKQDLMGMAVNERPKRDRTPSPISTAHIGSKRGIVRFPITVAFNMTPAMGRAFDAYRRREMVGKAEAVRRLVALGMEGECANLPPVEWHASAGRFHGFLHKGVRLKPEYAHSVNVSASINKNMADALDGHADSANAPRGGALRFLAAMGLVKAGCDRA